MCFPFPGLLRHVIKPTVFDLLPLNYKPCRKGVQVDVNASEIYFRVREPGRESKEGKRLSAAAPLTK